MTDVYCEWESCYWYDSTRGKCTYDGRVYLVIAKENNETGDLLECEQYLYLEE